VVEDLGGRVGECNDGVSKVSVVGLAMATETGVANRMFRALSRANINLQMITTSEIKISVLVDRSEGLGALRCVHEEFRLHETPARAASDPFAAAAARQRTVAPVEVIERLRGFDMEGITIDGVELDDSQSRITLLRVPNVPGMAARIFDALAAAEIFVDMIAQSYFQTDFAHLSLTVPRTQFESAMDVVRKLMADFPSCHVMGKKGIAKISVSGIGLRSHTGMAIKMFEALLNENIALEMMNTSEVRVNAVVDHAVGQKALQALQAAFQTDRS
jgi:aspartate kinase